MLRLHKIRGNGTAENSICVLQQYCAWCDLQQNTELSGDILTIFCGRQGLKNYHSLTYITKVTFISFVFIVFNIFSLFARYV